MPLVKSETVLHATEPQLKNLNVLLGIGHLILGREKEDVCPLDWNRYGNHDEESCKTPHCWLGWYCYYTEFSKGVGHSDQKCVKHFGLSFDELAELFDEPENTIGDLDYSSQTGPNAYVVLKDRVAVLSGWLKKIKVLYE